MARTSLVMKIHELSNDRLSKKKIDEAISMISRLKRRKRLSAREKMLLEESARRIKLELLFSRDERRFLKLSTAANEVLSKDKQPS